MARTWLGAFGGLVAWSAHLVLSYAVISLACRDGRSLIGDVALVTVLLTMTIALAALAVASAVAATRGIGSPVGWMRFFGIWGVLLGALSTGTILLAASQLLALPPCA